VSGGRSLHAWLDHIQSVHFRSIDMSLDRVSAVLARLVPAPAFRVVAVAGTNGKGSCAAMLAAVLSACGHRTGLYTSPHLVRFNERIRIDGEPAVDRSLGEAFEAIEQARAGIPLTYFEFATLAAVLLFHRAGLDYAVMEVGMGGRLDAVNALSPDASLVTNVALDHTQWLGPDRESIGREKAHIMRPGRPAVFNHPDVPASVTTHAAQAGVRLLIAGRDYRALARPRGWRWLGPDGQDWALPDPPMTGDVQRENAAGVLALLSRLPHARLTPAAAVRGIANTRIAGRCEIVAREPLVIVDVAHNLSAIAVLRAYLRSCPAAGDTLAVFGLLKDKDAAGIARQMDDVVDAWFLAGIDDARGQSAACLRPVFEAGVRSPVHVDVSAVAAYERARRGARAMDRILVFGSFHVAGDIIDHMQRPC